MRNDIKICPIIFNKKKEINLESEISQNERYLFQIDCNINCVEAKKKKEYDTKRNNLRSYSIENKNILKAK